MKIESPNGSTTTTPKKQPPKSIKSRKISKKCLPMGPQGGPQTHFFALFEPRGTPGDPQGYQRSPRRPKEASKRQFGVIFAPICIHVRPILPQSCRTFRLRFSYVFPLKKINNRQLYISYTFIIFNKKINIHGSIIKN